MDSDYIMSLGFSEDKANELAHRVNNGENPSELQGYSSQYPSSYQQYPSYNDYPSYNEYPSYNAYPSGGYGGSNDDFI